MIGGRCQAFGICRGTLDTIAVDGSDNVIEWGISCGTADREMLLHLTNGDEVTGIIDVYGIVRRGIDIICQVIAIAGVDGSTPAEVVPIGSALHL